MNFKSLLTGLCCILFLNGLFAQKKNFDDVISINLNNVNAIKSNEDITGYYMFFKADDGASRGKDYNYRIAILNENAEQVAEKNISGSIYFYILEASYNQDLLCFKFYDAKKKTIRLEFIDKDAKTVYTKTYEADKIERQLIIAAAKAGSDVDPSLYPIEGKGFLSYRMVKNKKPGYEITYYPNDSKAKGWKYGSKSESPVLEMASCLESNQHVVLNLVTQTKNRMSRDGEYSLLALDPENGKKMFETRLKNSRYEESIINSYFDDATKQIHLFGFYFKKGDDPMKGKSLGMSQTVIDLSGKELDKKYISWKGDVAKFLPANEKGKIDDIGFIYFHEFLKMDDGSFAGVGEAYKKAVSGLGVASNILAVASGSAGSGASAVKVVVEDFYLFNFDKDFNITGVKMIDKSKTNVDLPAGAAYYGPQYLSKYVSLIGGFDFSYLKQINDGKTFVVFYQDYEKRKGEKNKSVAGVVSYVGGIYTQDKIDIDTEADFIKVLPAQGGNVLFLEYFRKKKDIELNFKKMNY